jgi:hypothetical protein
MIDYNAFHSYLVEMVALYQRTRSTKGMSQLAQKYHCTALTRDQFYQMKLDRLEPGQVTPQLSRVVRDTIGRSEAKQTLLDTIGALNEGILAGSRISQGSDRTVQITITQPTGSTENPNRYQPPTSPAATQTATPSAATQGFSGRLPLYKPGQVLYHKGSGELFLVSRLLDCDRLTYRYTLGNPRYANQTIGDMAETSSFWLGNDQLRPAKGSEVARFLGALTRSGYEWTADNANGLFFVKPRQQERKPVEVFANELPDGCRTIYALPAVAPSPYRYALDVESPVDFAHDYMTDRRSTYPAQTNAILRQLRQAVGSDVAHGGFGSIRDYYEYTLPSLCSAYSDGSMREHTVALVKDSNNGTTYWLARDRDVLRLLAWVAYII